MVPLVRPSLGKFLEFRRTGTEMACLLAARTSYFRGYQENGATSHHHTSHWEERLRYLRITGWFPQSDIPGGRLGLLQYCSCLDLVLQGIQP